AATLTPLLLPPADGPKLPDIYPQPPSLREDLQRRLGTFPLFEFWGPGASIRSSRWIAQATRLVEESHAPTLTLIYLPHLDYGLQRHGPRDPAAHQELRDIDAVCGDLIDFYEERGAQVVILSEYGITGVSNPVHLNRKLRTEGVVAIREELGRELLDPGASAAFAVADHQVAHVYVNDATRTGRVREILEGTPGVQLVLGEESKRGFGLSHPRAGDLVAIAARDA